MKKPNYIEKIEVDEGMFFSVMNLPNANNKFVEYVKDKFELVYSVADIGLDLKIFFKEKIYQTKQDFYLYLLITDNDNIEVKVYYKQKQLSEFRLIIGQLLKQTNLWKLQKKN